MARILVVEDDDLVAKMYQFILEKGGNEFSRYTSGKEVLFALDREEEISYDLGIADRCLKDISGDVVVDRLKQRYPHRPIIKVSGYDYPCPPELRPADRFLKKPFEPRKLIFLVDDLLK